MNNKYIVFLKISQIVFKIIFNNTNINVIDGFINQYENFVVNKNTTKNLFTININIIKQHGLALPKQNKNLVPLNIDTSVKGSINLKNNEAIFESDDSLQSFRWILVHVFNTVALCKYQTILLHASSVEKNEQTYVFFGPQGAGKSTISTLGENNIINDDMTVIQIVDNKPYVFSTPFDKKLPTVKNMGFPLKNIFFLKQAKYNKISNYNNNQISLVLNNMKPNLAYYAQSSYYKKRLFQNTSRILKTVTIKKLFFKKNPQFWKVINEQEK